MMARLVTSPEYKAMKKIATTIAFGYRSTPGNTTEEDVSYLKHCNLLWGFNSMFKQVEDIAKIQPKEREDDNGWD